MNFKSLFVPLAHGVLVIPSHGQPSIQADVKILPCSKGGDADEEWHLEPHAIEAVRELGVAVPVDGGILGIAGFQG